MKHAGGKSSEFRADLHIHTCYSFDSLSSPKSILAAAQKKGLSAIAITDHNEVEGAFEAAEIAKEEKSPIQVIVGEEVSTSEGDLLVYFLKKKIEPGSLSCVLEEAKRQKAICSAAHPYDFMRSGIALEKLPSRWLALIDAIEALNARASAPSQNTAALEFARRHKKPVLAGSDAHHPSEVGAAYAKFSGIKKLDKESMLSAKRILEGKLSPKFVHLFSRYAAVKNKAALLFGKRYKHEP